MSVYVGRWDCPTCGNVGVLGLETKCPNCGASRPENVRFYLPSDAEIVKDEKRIKEAQAGVDWICGHCNTQNKAANTQCASCGNTRDEASGDEDLQTREYHSHEVPTASFERERSYHPEEKGYQKKKPRKKGFFGKIAASITAILVSIFGFPALQKTVDVTVQDFKWERSVEVFHFEPTERESWDLPQGAYNVGSFKAVKGYNKVLRGYENKTIEKRVKVGERTYVCGKIDKGNGYFVDKYCKEPIYETRTENKRVPVYDRVPIYGTKYKFTIKDWVAKAPLQAAAQNHDPQWPQLPSQGKDWKEGRKTESYSVIVREEDGELHEEKVGPRYWSRLDYNQKIPAKHSIILNFYYGLADEDKDQ